jgi:copper oxidase (laccase) domain-containing protein
VDEPVVGPLAVAHPRDWRGWVAPSGPGKWQLDLWQAGHDQLAVAGVPPAAIANPRLCTSCRRDLFFSYRREGNRGRLATIALLP